MYKNLIFVVCCALMITDAGAAIRDGNVASRAGANISQSQRVVATNSANRGTSTRNTSVLGSQSHNTAGSVRTAATSATSRSGNTTSRSALSVTSRTVTNAGIQSRATDLSGARATDNLAVMSQTRTGAEYEQCKNAYFTCMDQFCQLKNDNYRRCSCSDRVYDLDDAFDVLQQAGEKLTTFTENLDVVGMTAAQATAMRNASEGENALTSDNSASKALLQAIMNSIRGDDVTVGGKFSNLNSISISFDTANAFGTADAGQIIGTYNGQNLYSAVYPQCRNAVRGDCNDASLQRAITAYLMAVEQDCNTVQSAIESKQKQMKSAVREGSAMLDLARVENRQAHNSSDFTTCLSEVETAVLSEEVCGVNYHRCLDNGEFIDISTGKPIIGVERFYELEKLLTFSDNVDASNQKLSKLVKNRQFVRQFEQRTKKFAEPALDKCVEQADAVWAEYLDKALLDIYYAQKAKVAEIKQGCFDFISNCYMNVDTGLTAAMAELTDDTDLVVLPDKIVLTKNMCSEYVNSCDNMFDGNIVAQYIDNRETTDTLAACRAAVKQCFDKFGGTGYQNFYYPYSGLFTTGKALDWLTLYDKTADSSSKKYKSECANQLADIVSCSDKVEEVFGGFDLYYTSVAQSNKSLYKIENSGTPRYGTKTEIEENAGSVPHLANHTPRPIGVATEIYYQIIDTLSTRCANLQGYFLELQHVETLGAYKSDNICLANFADSKYKDFVSVYGIGSNENMCPRDYWLGVDIKSWGACLCWENGGRRSKWGKSPTCLPILPDTEPVSETNGVATYKNDAACDKAASTNITSDILVTQWCMSNVSNNKVCTSGDNGCSYTEKQNFPIGNTN